jgi:hypothetical protein
MNEIKIFRMQGTIPSSEYEQNFLTNQGEMEIAELRL